MQHTDKTYSLPKIGLVLIAALLVNSCGSDSDSDNTSIDEPNGQTEFPSIDSTTEVAIDPAQTDLLDQLNPVSIGGSRDNELAEDNGDLLPGVFPTTTSLDLAYAQSGAALVEQLNESLVLPADIDVDFTDCGLANAFYVPPGFGPPGEQSAGGSIIMCHELTELFFNLYGNSEQAFITSAFVLMHELGHALVNQLNLPVLGIEESYVDGMGAVFMGEAGLAEGVVLAGWFFFSQPESPFFDTHRAGPQRLGDLACWGVGADPSLLDDPMINSIAQQLISSGRNCPLEYAQQLGGFNAVLDQHIRGGLGELSIPAIENSTNSQ